MTITSVVDAEGQKTVLLRHVAQVGTPGMTSRRDSASGTLRYTLAIGQGDPEYRVVVSRRR